ncbi:MAG: hypothetical protein JXA83_00875, partial [Acidimicrobiales bacterium]|nr:hypothetical protein [Acidimicrobiales bacterium]
MHAYLPTVAFASVPEGWLPSAHRPVRPGIRATTQRHTRRDHTMPGWNFADVWEVIAEQIPDAQAQVH